MDEISTFSTYTSNMYGFSVDYPSNWLISENNSFFVVGFRESNEETYPSFNIQIIELQMFGPNLSNQSFEEMIRSQILRVGAKADQFRDDSVGQFKGRSIIFYIPDNHMKSKQTYFFHKDYAYIISYTSKADDYFVKHLFVHDHAISSFTIIESKGYKFLQLKSQLHQLINNNNSNSESQSIYLEYYYPKQWKESNVTKNSIKYKDDVNSTNELLVSFIDNSKISLPDYIDKEFNNKSGISNKTLSNKSIKLNNFIFDLGNKINMDTGKQMEYSNEENDQDLLKILFEFDSTIVDFTFTCKYGEMKYWKVGFLRLIEYFGIINHQNKKAKSNVPYDVFDNVMIGYSFRVPKSFELTSCKPTGEFVSFKDNEETDEPIPYCLRVLVEDLTDYPGQLKVYEYSNEVISKLLQQPEAKLLTDDPGFVRLDKYLAQTCSMQSFDVEIRKPALRLIVTSVQKNHGIVLTIRTLPTQFNNIYKKSFYVFDTFNFYKLNNNSNK